MTMLGPQSVAPVWVGGFDYTAERSGDGDPPLYVHLERIRPSEPACHRPALLDLSLLPAANLGPGMTTADRAAATARSAALVPLLGPITGLCPAAVTTWGDVCSSSRRISSFDESGCLYEVPRRFGSWCPCAARSHRWVRDAMGFYGNQQEILGTRLRLRMVCAGHHNGQQAHPEMNTIRICAEKQKTTTYR